MGDVGEGGTYCGVLESPITNHEHHHLLFGCHIAVGDMAPGFCVKKRNGRDGCADSPDMDSNDITDYHCQMMQLHCCHITSAMWIIVVVEEESWGLLIMFKLGTGIC